jgi:hypothetical protein
MPGVNRQGQAHIVSTAIRLPRSYEPDLEVEATPWFRTWFSIDPQPASISPTINISIVFICAFLVDCGDIICRPAIRNDSSAILNRAGSRSPKRSAIFFPPRRGKPCGPKPSELGFAYSHLTTIMALTLPLRSKPSFTRVPGRTSCGANAPPSLSARNTLLASMYDTGLASGEDCTTIGEGGSTFPRPGLNAVTVPTITAPVVICVGACRNWPECSTTEVYATGEVYLTGCPNASGAIIAQARTLVIRLMCFPFTELAFRSCFAWRNSFGCS